MKKNQKYLRGIVRGVVALALVACAVGCNSFERTTYQTLATSKAVIDQAQADYEARTIPHTQPVYVAITTAKQAQTTAVDAFLTYEQVKQAKGDTDAQQQIVVVALGRLPVMIADIKAFYPQGGK
jgi:hypothetical protein